MPAQAAETQIFDYVIVGAGSAGSLLSYRLSEDASRTVCVLEAGGPDLHPYIHVPAGFIRLLHMKSLMWNFETEPSEGTAGRRIGIPQGRVLGGSTSINGQIYNRGQPADFDRWAALGNSGWGFADMLPYLKRTERWLGPTSSTQRGTDGRLTVIRQDWRTPLADAFVAGTGELGIPAIADHNDGRPVGTGYYQRTARGRFRQSMSTAYLRPAMKRDNVDVRTGALVDRLLFEGRRAVGVAYRTPDGRRVEVRARREVILSAGTVNTTRLMQVCGIGNPDVLSAAGVPVFHALAGVGGNFRDHYATRMVAKVRNAGTINEMARPPRLWWEIAKWMAGGRSVLNLGPSLVHVLWKSDEALPGPDLQCSFMPGSYREGHLGALDVFPGMTCGIYQQRPESVGYVHIASPRIEDAPKLQPNYLGAEADRRSVVGGLKLVRRLLATEALRPYHDGEVFPGHDVRSDDELLDFARRKGGTAYHLIGTAKMGPADDPLAVVSPDLKVRGLEGLRVVDASVMPLMPSGNINAPTMAVAEKAAVMIATEARG